MTTSDNKQPSPQENTVIMEPTYTLSETLKSVTEKAEELLSVVSGLIQECRANYEKLPWYWRIRLVLHEKYLIPSIQKGRDKLQAMDSAILTDSDQESERKLGRRRVKKMKSKWVTMVKTGDWVIKGMSEYKVALDEIKKDRRGEEVAMAEMWIVERERILERAGVLVQDYSPGSPRTAGERPFGPTLISHVADGNLKARSLGSALSGRNRLQGTGFDETGYAH